MQREMSKPNTRPPKKKQLLLGGGIWGKFFFLLKIKQTLLRISYVLGSHLGVEENN